MGYLGSALCSYVLSTCVHTQDINIADMKKRPMVQTASDEFVWNCVADSSVPKGGVSTLKIILKYSKSFVNVRTKSITLL